MEIDELEEGQKIVFNDRKQPLKVESVENGEAKVSGPGGGEYVLYSDEGTDLVAKKGNKKYSSYLENLRKVGKWEETEKGWKHSRTGAEVKIVEEGPTWKIRSERFDFEQPRYGFTDRTEAVEKAEQIINKYPEGKMHEES